MNTWADELLNKCLKFSVENRDNLVAWPVSSRTARPCFICSVSPAISPEPGPEEAFAIC